MGNKKCDKDSILSCCFRCMRSRIHLFAHVWPHEIDGYKVLCIYSLYTVSLHNIEHIMSYPQFIFMSQDVTILYCVSIYRHVLKYACQISPTLYKEDVSFMSETLFSLVLKICRKRLTDSLLQPKVLEMFNWKMPDFPEIDNDGIFSGCFYRRTIRRFYKD